MKRGKKSEVRSQRSVRTGTGADLRPLGSDLSPFSVGQRVYLAIAGYPISHLRSPNSHRTAPIFLPKGARGVVTQADPTGDILTIQFDLPSGPVAGLRLPVTHVCKINHDVQPVRPD